MLLGLAGLFSNPFLLFIAFFVWIGAGQEASMMQMKTSLGGIPVSKAMLTDSQVLSPHDIIGRAAKLILSGLQTDFPVLEGNEVMGVLTRTDVLGAISVQGKDVLVTGIMRHEIQIVDAKEMLEPAFARL